MHLFSLMRRLLLQAALLLAAEAPVAGLRARRPAGKTSHLSLALSSANQAPPHPLTQSPGEGRENK